MQKWYLEDELQKIVLIIYSFVVWLLLTWTLNWQHLIAGGVISILVGILFGKHFVQDAYKVFNLKRWFWFLVYVPVFIWEMAKANFDVAYRVIHPRMPIEPGIVKVKTQLKSEMGKTFLANSITLTPGTFTIDIKDEYLYIHCIKVKYQDVDKASKYIVGRFEKLLLKIFD
jgi:multicomponent Na+:H+ antiporter subunit E